MLTRRGGRWHVSTVTNLLDRLEPACASPRLMSLVHAVTNVVIGLVVAVATQIVVFPVLGLQASSLVQNLRLALVFTVVSIGRSFLLRRLFEAMP
jgi:uncharacterized protein YacL